jgi:S1-C subfamily serine protease
MPAPSDWNVPPEVEPRAETYDFDLDAALAAVVAVKATIPADAFTAEVLGAERSGHGVVIDRAGVVLTIGYLITEAESVWLTTGDGRQVPATVLGFDQDTGFGLLQALGRLDLPSLPLGDSAALGIGARAVAAGAGGRHRSVATRVVARQEFAGYWEYVLDDAIFTHPAHPYWGGTALIGDGGKLLGIGSLQLQHEMEDGENAAINMFVPIDLLKPVQNDLMTLGRPSRPVRPWLGLYATEVEDRVVIAGLATKGPAEKGGLKIGDMIVAVAGSRVSSLTGLYRKMWALGTAGVAVPLTVFRDGQVMEIRVTSGDRASYLKKPKLH